jgi:hypothetical protein
LSFIFKLEEAISKNIIASLIGDIGKNFCIPELPQELGPGDRTLADFFYRNRNFLFFLMSKTYCDITALCPQLPNHLNLSASPTLILDEKSTFTAFLNAADLSLKSEANKALYTKETALTFHHLLYFSFLMAGRALGEIKDSSHNLAILKSAKKEAAFDAYKKAIRNAAFPIRFLICMLSSSAFRLHMKVWTEEGASLKILLPIFEHKSEYLMFGKDRGILGSLKQGPQSQAPTSLEDDLTEADLTEVRQTDLLMLASCH